MNIKLNEYEIILKRGLLDNIELYIDTEKTIVIFTDDGVPFQYIKKITKKLKKYYVKIVKQGEQSKSLETYEECMNFLIENYISRNDLIICIGGGVVLDLGGFIASTYKRGIPFINIPTTTLSQIDSSIGGKVGINFKDNKNCIGSFYNPKKVLIDFNTLDTLKDRIYNEGIVEALKVGMIKDKYLFELIEENIKQNIEEIIYRSLLIKKEVVELDFKETNIRKVLNFGHTIGHAYESYYNYKYKHGECVAMGILSILDDEKIKERVKKILIKINIPIKNDANKNEVFKYIKNDKKATNNFIDIIKVNEIGSCEIVNVKINDLKERCSLSEK